MAEDSAQMASVPQIESHGRLMDTVERRAKAMRTLQLGGLILVGILLVGFLVFRGTSAGKAPEPGQSAAVHKTTTVAEADAKAPGRPEMAFATAPISNSRDPFEPLVVAKVPGSMARPRPLSGRMAAAGALPPMNLGALPPAAVSSPGTQVEQQPDPTADLSVTGILCGNPSVAVIRDKSAGRHYVRVGDKIGERLTVLSIERGRVLLQAGGKNVVLMLGGNKDASKS